MATLNICDRCETPTTSTAAGSMTWRPNITTDVTSIELCPGCVGDMVAFLTNGTTQKRPRAYKEPWEEKTGHRGQLRDTLRELLRGEETDDRTWDDAGQRDLLRILERTLGEEITEMNIEEDCPVCNGTGEQYVNGRWVTCSNCGGSGIVTKTV